MSLQNLMNNLVRPIKLAFQHRSLLRGFVGREVKGRFAGNVAGMAWALLNPLATLLVYMFVFSMVIRVAVTAQETGTDSFFIYFITGFLPWIIFSDSLARATGALLDNASLITKVVFPVELLPMTSVLSGLLVNGLGMVLMLIYLSLQGFLSSIWLFLILVLPLQILFTLGVGMLLSSACVYLRDIREMIGLILMVWFFSTPIIYPLSMVPHNIQSLIQFNPMYMFVDLYRDILLFNALDMKSLISAIVLTLVMYTLGAQFFARVKPGFGDVL